MFRWGIGSGTLVVIAFLAGLRWGIVGMAVAYAIASFLLSYPSFWIPFRLVDLKFVQLLRVLRSSFLNSGLMFVMLVLFIMILPSSLPDVIILLLSVILGVAIYTAATWLTNREQLKELWDLTGLNRRKLHDSG